MSADDPAVRATGLAAGYPGAPAIWENGTFELSRGEFVAVLGSNGAGKSTLLKLVLGMMQPVAGTLQVLGGPPQRGNPRIGYVPQGRNVDTEMAVRGVDIVRLGLDGHRYGLGLAGRRSREGSTAAIAEAIGAVGATEYAHRRIGQISGGERQRLWLAQALVSQPELLLLDEPLASLDLRHQAAMAELVGDLARERQITVMLVAHDVNPLRHVVEKVCYIAGGGIAIGPPDEVLTAAVLSPLYGAPVEVLVDSNGRRFVVGIGEELAHPHLHGEER